MARRRIDQASTAQRMVLRPAICALLQGGADDLDFRDKRTEPWLDAFDDAVDRVFFGDLWSSLDLSREEREQAWNGRLLALAREQLADAMSAAPVPLAQRPRALARAELIFRGAARKHLPIADPASLAATEDAS